MFRWTLRMLLQSDNSKTKSGRTLKGLIVRQNMRLYIIKISVLNFEVSSLLTPRCRVLLEQLTGLQLVKKFPAFHGNRRLITALTSVRHLSILGQPNPVHIPTSNLLEIRPNIIHPSTPRSTQWSLSPRFPQQITIRTPKKSYLTLYLLMWKIWWAPNNNSKGKMGFKLAFKGLKVTQQYALVKCADSDKKLI